MKLPKLPKKFPETSLQSLQLLEGIPQPLHLNKCLTKTYQGFTGISSEKEELTGLLGLHYLLYATYI
jgi:hypothetical protein